MATLEELLAAQAQEQKGVTLDDLLAMDAAERGGSAVDQRALGELRQGVNALGRGIKNGATFGLGDEREALLTGGVLGGRTDESGDFSLFNYDEGAISNVRDLLANERGANENAKETNAGPFAMGDIAGALPVSVAGGAVAAGGRGLVGTAGRLLGVGAAEGGVIGAGNADGEDTLRKAGIGAGIGAGVGLAAQPVASAARWAGRRIADPIRGAIGGSETIANRQIGKTLDRANMTPSELHKSLLDARADGQTEFNIADALGNSGQRTLSGVARQPGAGRTDVVEALDNRQLGQRERLSQYLADATGTTDTAAQRRASLEANRSATANVNYDAARENAAPVDVRGALGVIDRRLAPFEGSGVQGDGIDSMFSKYRSRLAADRVPVDIDSRELSDFDRVLGVKQDLADDISAATRAGRNNEARELKRIHRELDQALEAASPDYRQANDTFADQSRTIEAIDAGSSAARPSVRANDTIDQFGALSPDAQDAFRAGYADPRLAAIERAAPGANAARNLQSPKFDAEMGAIANDPEMLRRRIGRENTMFETRRQATGGSQTADNLADNQDVAGDVGMLASILRGQWGQAATGVTQKALTGATGQNEATRQMIARALLSNDPEEALKPVVRQIGKDQTQQGVLAALLRRAALNERTAP